VTPTVGICPRLWAVASRRADPLVNDPFAETLVKAAGVELFARLANGDLDFDDIGPTRCLLMERAWECQR
jgi:O-methyltransferase involved in polyketide biosynthesis